MIYDVYERNDVSFDAFKTYIKTMHDDVKQITFAIDDDDTYIVIERHRRIAHVDSFMIASRDDATLSRDVYAYALSCDMIVATTREFRETIICE